MSVGVGVCVVVFAVVVAFISRAVSALLLHFRSIFRFVFDCLLKGAACAYATLFALFLSLAHGHGHTRAQS